MSEVGTAPEWIRAIVDLSTNSTTVCAYPCIFRGVSVITALSGQACPIKDDTTQIATLPASLGVGSWAEAGDQTVLTSLVVDPDDSATGTINVIYKPINQGQAGSGAGLPA